MLVGYLNCCRKEYIRICGLDGDRIISEMPAGRAYLQHRLDIRLREKNLPRDLGEVAIILFKRQEKEVVKKI